MIPLITRKIHVSIDFTLVEYYLLKEIADRLAEETKGRFQIEMLQDLDDNHYIYMPKDHWRIVRLLNDSEASKNFDAVRGVHIWGLCSPADNTIYLIPDRAKGEIPFMHVAEHELLHSIGVRHTNDRLGIMYKFVGDDLPLTFRPSDRAAFCEAVGCDVREVWK